jgi:hypothetical protein
MASNLMKQNIEMIDVSMKYLSCMSGPLKDQTDIQIERTKNEMLGMADKTKNEMLGMADKTKNEMLAAAQRVKDNLSS